MSPNEDSMNSGAAGRLPSPHNLLVPSTVTDFAKKLHGMLENPTFETLVCWGPQNDCFIIKDINEFSVSVLPQIFNHWNFSSFVRQLNKYDFHKTKQVDQGGKQSCVFYHQHFHRDRPHDLQHIKRKVKSTELTQAGTSSGLVFSNHSDHPPVNHTSSSTHVTSPSHPPANMKTLVENVVEEKNKLWERLWVLETNHELMQSELGRMEDQMGQNNAIIEALRNRFGGLTELGNVTSGPPFSAPITTEGTRNVYSSGSNRTSESLSPGHNPVPHIPRLDSEEMATRPDFHGISVPPNVNTRRQDSTLRSYAFGSQSIAGQPTPVILPVTAGPSAATDRGLPAEIFHSWSNTSELPLQRSQQIPQGTGIRRQGQDNDDASSGSSHRPNSSPALFLPEPRVLGTLNKADISVGFDGQLGRRGRSFSVNQRIHVEARTTTESRRQVGRQISDAQSVCGFIGSSGEGTEFKGEHGLTKEYNQGELRGSDGTVYRQGRDPGAGAVSGHIETVGKWSFDTSAVATTRGLHGLGIAVIGPHPANASDAVKLMDCDSDISPTMLQSD